MMKIILNKPKKYKSTFNFKLIHTFEKRLSESERIKEKYPDVIPIIIEKADNSPIQDLDKHKYLMKKDATVGQLLYMIRKNINLSSEQAVFLFVDDLVPQLTLEIGKLYEKSADKDGFLYISYAPENAFG